MLDVGRFRIPRGTHLIFFGHHATWLLVVLLVVIIGLLIWRGRQT